MKLWITGLNHKSAPVSVREKLAIKEQDLPEALNVLQRQPGVREGLILSTCNRVEVAVAAEDSFDPRQCVELFLSATQHLDPEWLRPYLYSYEGREAAQHIFRVAASLDSMVIGEPQILGQLKTAYTAAKQAGTVSGLLDTVVTRAFNVAKRVRTETEIGSSAVSISYAAVELAREIFGTLNGKAVMLIGAGKMSELAARHLRRSGVKKIFVTNRTPERAERLAAVVDGTIVAYEDYRRLLKNVDIVLASSAAPGYLLNKSDMRPILSARKNRPMFLIDIAVPRNIDPAVNELDSIFLYDIDDLQKVVEQNLQARLSEAGEADKIVAEELDRLESSLRSREAGPLILQLQEQFEQVRLAELERVRGKLPPLLPQQEQALEAMTRSIVNKIAHGPISELRRSVGTEKGTTVADMIRSMFRLEG